MRRHIIEAQFFLIACSGHVTQCAVTCLLASLKAFPNLRESTTRVANLADFPLDLAELNPV